MLAHPRAADRVLAALYDRISPAVEGALIETLRRFARTVPAPRNDPFYGVDRRPGPSLRALERLTAHGDFRKYVFVLDGGGGLGGVARWLTLTYGCRVLVLDVLPRVLAVGQRLTRRAHLDGRVAAVAGTLEAIPVRDATFTQIWSVAALHHVDDRAVALRELFRVLRPGSTLALHEVVRRSDTATATGSPWRYGTEREYLTLLGQTGFVTIIAQDVTGEDPDISPVTRSVEDAFVRLLAGCAPAEAEAWRERTRELERIDALERDPDHRAVQFFARRPSV